LTSAPLLGVSACDRPEQHHAGVVDEDVEAAELRVGGADEAPGRLLVGNVDLDRQRAAAVRLDPPGERVDPVLAPGAERDRAALGRERQRRCLADPGRCAGDRCDLAVE
jgi:hypothetical protein